MTNYLSTEEKIDYIYKELKSQKRSRVFGLILKLFVVLGVVYFFVYILPQLDTDWIINQAINIITDLVRPITENLLKSLMDTNAWSTWDQSSLNNILEQIKNHPELLNNLNK